MRCVVGSGPSYMICVTHFALKKPTDMRENCVNFSHVRGFFDSRNVRQNLMPRATAFQCVLVRVKYVYVQVYVCVCARTYVCRTYPGRWRHSDYTARARRAEGIQRREGPLSAGVVTLSHSTALHIMKLRCKQTFRPRM